MHVSLLGSTMTYSLAIAPLIAVYALLSAAVPAFWKNKYSLYASFAIAFLSFTLTVDSLIFRYRYLVSKGYYVLPTPTGYIYFQSRTSLSFGPPFWFLLALLVVSELNLSTKASWLSIGRRGPIQKALSKLDEGPLRAVEAGLKAMGLPYERKGNRLIIDSVIIYQGTPSDNEKGEYFAFRDGTVVHSWEGGAQEMGTEDGVRAVLGAAVSRARTVEKNEYESERCPGRISFGLLGADERGLRRRDHDLRRRY